MNPHQPPRRAGPRRCLALAGVLVVVALVSAAALPSRTPRRVHTATQHAWHAVTIRSPAGVPVIPTGQTDPHGLPITVACNTCHTTRPANNDAHLGKSLTAFHQSLAGKHGNLACTACHNPADGYQSLRLAHGASVPFAEVMRLCAQCHGPQYRDYLHGAHGGMTGFWDLNKGPRVRNNCVHCHDPHAPRYGTVQPARGPGDVPAAKKGERHE